MQLLSCTMAPTATMCSIGNRCKGIFLPCRSESSPRQKVGVLMRALEDDELPSVEMRKDGRLFMEESSVVFEEDTSVSYGDKEQPSRKRERGLARKARAETRKAQTRNLEETESLPRKASGDGERSGWRRKTGEEDASRQARIREKKPPLREQVYLPSIQRDPQVAIIGGGMSGLVCALTLEERGIRSTVFDTGKHGLGGRMGTRHIVQPDRDQSLVFDHAAQYFTVTDSNFQKLVDEWISEGEVTEWKGDVGVLREGQFTQLPHSAKFVATHGMRALADYMISKARLITVDRPCWISSMEPLNGRWYLTENGLGHGSFDAVVIAHNGKCANRLLAPSGAPLVAKQMKRLELSSIWALLAAFDEPLPQSVPFDGAFVEGVSSLSWMANNSKKLSGDEKVHPHCWTFFSTAAYGKKHKVPQESIPSVKAERVRREMLRGAEMALGLSEGSLPVPSYTRVQLWGAALPTNTPGVPCIFDPQSRVGICGDWLLGASLEAAALSGMALAHHIANYCEKAETGYFNEDVENLKEFSVGLTTPLLSLDGHDIGQFGTSTPQKQDIKGRALAVK